MSKISDALDKADRERRAREQAGGAELATCDQGPSLSGDVPDKIWRELGIMRNLVESYLPSKKNRSLLLTSAAPEEGVSTVVANLARALADDPLLNVLVVDANAGDAVQHTLFGLENTRGLLDLVRGDAKFEEAVRPTTRNNLNLLTSGAATGGVFQLFGADRMAGLLADLAPRFQYIVLDAPPVLSHPETAILGSHVDGVVLVVRALRTRREAVARARDTLVKSGCNVIGIVLNRYKYSIPEFIYKRV